MCTVLGDTGGTTMAKRSKRSSLTVGRDVVTIARRSPRPPVVRLPRLSLVSPLDLSVFEDRRLHYPVPPGSRFSFRPAAALPRSAARLVVRDTPVRRPGHGRFVFRPRQTKAVVAFDVPSRVAVCVRRNRRREVLHALKVAGRSGGFRKRQRSEFSSVSCR